MLSRQCVHDIPVEVISRKYWESYEEPKFNDFHVCSALCKINNHLMIRFCTGFNSNAKLEIREEYRGENEEHRPYSHC